WAAMSSHPAGPQGSGVRQKSAGATLSFRSRRLRPETLHAISRAALAKDASTDVSQVCFLHANQALVWRERSPPDSTQTLQIADLYYVADDFRTTEVGERYAQALFDLSQETGALDAVRGDLASLKAA